MNITGWDVGQMQGSNLGGRAQASPVHRADPAGGTGRPHRPVVSHLVAYACAMGGAVREAVYVSADVLRGRYDNF